MLSPIKENNCPTGGNITKIIPFHSINNNGV